MSDKVRRLWLPSLVVLLVILTLSWLVSSLFYPVDIQGNSPDPITPAPPTDVPVVTGTNAPASTVTVTMVNVNTPTLAMTATANCTYTTNYWQLNPQAWLIENVVIGNNSYTKAEAIEILDSPALDEKTALFQQFLAALLNTLKGADSRDVETTLLNASNWINEHATGVGVSDADRQEAIAFTQTLLEYNIGSLGPGHCPDEPVTPTPTLTSTPTSTPTPTITPIRTFTTPTDIPTERRPTEPKPTDAPTEAPTDQPPPTNTPEPQPSDTPRPTPTQAPTQPPPTEPPTSEPPPPTP